MKKLFEAAFKPPPKAGDAGAGNENFAILPRQAPNELALSEVHTNLDKVLLFLQCDIGYALLDDARPGGGGNVALRPGDSRSVGLARKPTMAPRDAPVVGDEEAKEVIRFTQDTARYAQYKDDLVLVWRFANMLVEASPGAADKIKHETFYKTVLQGIRLMHLCDFNYSDVVVTLAYASAYFRSAFSAIGHKMGDTEAAYVCVLLIYLAHSFVLDETCPLRFWQTHIFRKYCNVKVLDAALFRLFHGRDFRLRITPEEEKHALSVLLCSSNGFDVILSLGNQTKTLDGQGAMTVWLGTDLLAAREHAAILEPQGLLCMIGG
eukprot:CAMPEP_0195117656 /NCGR_PEP_ID=MMETSP0448-20130528/114814_1 /TAXON_ID=66468 /ORGANISM="Heterocapsa triquestra, Strain CCMP 448" /LENGTH=320 /DNA_ID=CAMNT_0040154877 /DNA_START=81 /DNA_END=1040 /DNA_ORIENTATION=-